MTAVVSYRNAGPSRRIGADANGNAIPWTFQSECAGCGDWFAEADQSLAYASSGRAYCADCVERSGGMPRPSRSDARVKLDVKVPDLFAAAKHDDFKPGIRRVLAGWPYRIPFVFGVGPTGHGKSHAGWAAVNVLAARGARCLHGYANEIKASWAALDPFDRERFAERWKRAAYVVWDDLTSASQSDGWGAFVHEVLDARIRERRPLMLLSTASVQDVGALLGDSIRSRLHVFEWVDFRPNGDRRQRGASRESGEKRGKSGHPAEGFQEGVESLAASHGLRRLPDGRFEKA